MAIPYCCIHANLYICCCFFPLAKSRRILSDSPPIPSDVTKPCRRLLKALLQKNPEKRLGFHGAQQVKDHPWFKVLNEANANGLYVCVFCKLYSGYSFLLMAPALSLLHWYVCVLNVGVEMG